MTRQINQAGIDLIKQNEGCSLRVYLDQAGLKTIATGHLITQAERLSGKFDNGITQEEADELLLHDVVYAEDAVERLISVQLNDNQFAALVSWVFNLGANALLGSSLRRKINKGDFNVDDEFLRWIYVRNQETRKMEVSPGLLARRHRELALWKTPAEPIVVS